MSSASTPRFPLRFRNVGFLPRGISPVCPSTIQFSAMSSSTIRETVLRCRPEMRARSARETGCLMRMWLKMRLRLISRAMRFEAFVWLFKKRRVVGIEILSPSDLERKQTKTFQNNNPVTSLRFYQQNRFSKLPEEDDLSLFLA